MYKECQKVSSHSWNFLTKMANKHVVLTKLRATEADTSRDDIHMRDMPNGNGDVKIKVSEEEKDPFDAIEDFKPVGPPWTELNTGQKCKRVLVTTAKIIVLLGLLYLFICSLSFLGSAFQLLGGKTAGEAISSQSLISNPVAGLMIGVLATVLLQSSSTTTSIVVAMVSSQILQVRPAIPIIMGANIGTSVTNTIVAFGQIADKDQFRRAFAGATVHDMFNLLCVLILLPVEVITGYLYHLTEAIVSSAELKTDKGLKKDLLKVITKPFTNLILQLDKKLIEKVAKGDKSAEDKSLIKFWCNDTSKMMANVTTTNVTTVLNMTTSVNVTKLKEIKVITKVEKCDFLFHDSGLSDTIVGIIMLVIALVILCICLVLIVKTLHSLLRGQIALVIKKTFNSKFPKPFGFLTGYVAILVGAGMTILVQSSSIFTSALTPLVGLGIVPLKKVYPLTLGANIGTTVTGILAALAASGDLQLSLQIALCHLFFNISGILIWYPVPLMRRIPIKMAKRLGNTTASYRWFALSYLVIVFFVMPALIFALSLAGWKVFVGVMVPIACLVVFIVIINIIQAKKKSLLPKPLQTWEWAPLMLRSLEPYDRGISKIGRKFKRR
ncbi:sodium-dependent phosphate transport protein 2B-like isoform X2 [Hydractinia symbiolongicarpus]|uniref:sodium-dependent phosphate transport protein 2B-like isoform X2 n=1 Tax=Hydractinia symbiolongicarpus TaxID=13093 RepID=UPI002550D67D|nr:sodium-dependent phosphate transport protein 2B-like isoform X2 [Hydractinia symbiolongicarpus]